MKFKARLCIVSCAIALSLGRLAAANGRYPQASQLVIDPTNPMHWVVRATFGILETPDAGQSWTWICEDAVGYFTSEDPAIAVTSDGTTLVAWSQGVSASRDGGCSWTRAAGNGFAVDVTVHPSDPHRAIAIVTSPGEGGRAVSLLETSDDGATFHEIGTPISGDFVGSTVEVAPSAEGRIYVGGNVQARSTGDSGQITVQPAVERSDDGGATWTRSILDLPGATAIFIGAVDPQNADLIYARTYISGNGVVLMSRDGGATWSAIFMAAGDILGLALSRDGTTLATGGPDIGIHVADTSDLVFRQTSDVGTSCLAWSDHRLLTCAKEALALFSIGVSDDLGAHFTPVMHLSSIEPRACAASSSAGVCAEVWPAVASLIQPDGGGSLEPNGSNPVGDESPPAQLRLQLSAGPRYTDHGPARAPLDHLPAGPRPECARRSGRRNPAPAMLAARRPRCLSGFALLLLPLGCGESRGANGRAIVLRMDDFVVPRGTESYRCQDFENSLGGSDFDVVRFASHVSEDVHHLTLFYKPGAKSGPAEPCSTAEFGASPYQTNKMDDIFSLPTKIGARVRGSDGVRLQSHYLNASNHDVLAEVAVVLFVAGSGMVVDQAGLLIASSASIDLAPFGTKDVTFGCRLPFDMTLLSGVSHMDAHGSRFSAALAAAPIYETTTSIEPAKRDYAPALAAHAGDELSVACRLVNDAPAALALGDPASTACAFLASYYPVPIGQDPIQNCR